MHIHIINLEEATPGMKLAESVYVLTGSGTNMLAARKGTELDANLIRMLTSRKVKVVEVFSEKPQESQPRMEPQPVQQRELKPLPPPIASSKPAPPPEEYVPVKSVIDDKLKEEAVDSVKQLFSCFTSKEGVNKTTAYQCVSDLEGVVGDLLGVLSDDATGLVHINDLKQFDEYTYHHSLSVSMLSMATGRELGLHKDDLFRLGRCAMLHDIGKQLIPLEIINKKGKLTDAEFDMVKNHPILGASTLKTNALGDVELWNGIMFHHEKINGTGYPKQLRGKDIPLFSKIISVADVYDAVTSYRSYRSPMLPSEAFELISRDIGVAFEYDVVRAFFSKLELYPVNTIVELSDGRLGMVVDCEGTLRLRPVIRIWGSTEIVNLASPANQVVEIVGVMDPSDLPDGYKFA